LIISSCATALSSCEFGQAEVGLYQRTEEGILYTAQGRDLPHDVHHCLMKKYLAIDTKIILLKLQKLFSNSPLEVYAHYIQSFKPLKSCAT